MRGVKAKRLRRLAFGLAARVQTTVSRRPSRYLTGFRRIYRDLKAAARRPA